MTSSNRYDVLIEHAIMESCIGNAKRSMTKKEYFRQRKTCACALTETQEDFDQDAYESDKGGFSKVFRDNSDDC